MATNPSFGNRKTHPAGPQRHDCHARDKYTHSAEGLYATFGVPSRDLIVWLITIWEGQLRLTGA